jgi:hypothetical protein
VLTIFISVSVDFGDKRGGSRSILLSKPSNLSSWEESHPVSGLVVPILNGDNKVGGMVICIEDKSIRSLLGLHLEALLVELSLQFSNLRVSYLFLRPLLTLRLTDAGNEPLHDIHDGFGVLLVEGEDGGGSAGRERWCRDGRSDSGRGAGGGLVRHIDGVVRHSGSVGVVVGTQVIFAEPGVRV